ncbi:hypothetical protein B857_03968 [Solibacillus isronensis B3W22]|uniref:Uncharacterized protein n=1 Tax=Solibacillus isronensis B3W22 TaxID=1224748 RepID=K1LFR3_9BACL|nr:hypothetical protein B857_03968 [Solibacillus isronensis B3W22]
MAGLRRGGGAVPCLGELDLFVDVVAQFGEPRQRAGVELVPLVGQIDGQILLNHRRRAGEDDHTFTQIDGLVDIVGDEQDGHAEFAPNGADQVLQVRAGLCVHGRKRFVHQQHLGLIGHGAGDGHALLHAAGKLPGVGLRNVGQAHGLQRVVDEPVAFSLGHTLVLQRQLHVLPHPHPGKE